MGLLPDDKGLLRSVPVPEIIGEGGVEPLLVHRGADGREHQIFFSSEPGVAGYFIIVREGSAWKRIGAMAGKPRCGMSVSSDEIAVSDGERMSVFSWNGEKWVQQSDNGEADYCDVVSGVVHSTISAQSGAFDVKTYGERTPSLSESGRAEIGRRLGAMYESMCGVAANSGLWIQPIVTMVRVLNRSGREIYRGIPRVIAPKGWQCAGQLTSTATVGSGEVTINDFRAEASGYYLELAFSGELDEEAATVELLASEQVHPVRPGEDAASRLTVRSTGSSVTAAMPGATYNFGERKNEWGNAIALKSAKIEKEGRVVARLEAGRFSGGAKVRIDALPWSLSRELSVQDESGTKRADGQETLSVKAKINGGSRWGARHCCVSGSTVLFADISVCAPEPPHPLQIAGAMTPYEGEWQAVTVLETASGERIAKCFDGNGAWPSKIAPMSVCAHRGATALKLYVELENGNTYKGEVGLTPESSGRQLSIYMDNTLEGRPLESGDYALPEESTPEPERYCGMILSADVSSPFQICGERVCGSAVNALCRSVRSRDSWEVGRARFYAFTPQGVSAVAVSGADKSIGATTICEAAVERPESVAVTPKGVYAVSGERLWNLRGTGAVSVENAFKGVVLGWSGAHEQLWSVDKAGNTEIRLLDSDGKVKWRTELPLPYAPKRFLDSTEGMLTGSDSASLILRGDAVREESAAIELETEITSPRAFRPIELYSALNGTNFCGRIELLAHGGAGSKEGRVVSRLDVNGSVNAPFSVRLLSDKHHRFALRVAGEVSADTYLEKFEMIFGK